MLWMRSSGSDSRLHRSTVQLGLGKGLSASRSRIRLAEGRLCGARRYTASGGHIVWAGSLASAGRARGCEMRFAWMQQGRGPCKHEAGPSHGRCWTSRACSYTLISCASCSAAREAAVSPTSSSSAAACDSSEAPREVAAAYVCAEGWASVSSHPRGRMRLGGRGGERKRRQRLSASMRTPLPCEIAQPHQWRVARAARPGTRASGGSARHAGPHVGWLSVGCARSLGDEAPVEP
eukprot:scaffold1168_cov123-Isochrysis_galbana.AAC.3